MNRVAALLVLVTLGHALLFTPCLAAPSDGGEVAAPAPVAANLAASMHADPCLHALPSTLPVLDRFATALAVLPATPETIVSIPPAEAGVAPPHSSRATLRALLQVYRI